MASQFDTGSGWTTKEVQLIVAEYFDMPRCELVGEPFVKSCRNAALRELISRSKASIEFKHRNISAVADEHGEPWITGYRPAVNCQKVFFDEIERLLDARPTWFRVGQLSVPTGVSDTASLFVEQPPLMSKIDHDKPEVLKRLVRKFDLAGRDARNRDLGKLG